MLSTGNDPVSQPYQGSVIPLYYESLVPGAGIEPARPFRKARDFKSLVSTYFTIRAFLLTVSIIQFLSLTVKTYFGASGEI